VQPLPDNSYQSQTADLRAEINEIKRRLDGFDRQLLILIRAILPKVPQNAQPKIDVDKELVFKFCEELNASESKRKAG
jgi:hypothetical protein